MDGILLKEVNVKERVLQTRRTRVELVELLLTFPFLEGTAA